jgi:hypothetical protein
MEVLELQGVLSNTTPEWPDTGPNIGGIDIVAAIQKHFGRETEVTLLIGRLEFQGNLTVYEGDCGYSEYTNWTLDCIQIGGVDLMNRITDYEGEHVILRIDDGPLD